MKKNLILASLAIFLVGGCSLKNVDNDTRTDTISLLKQKDKLVLTKNNVLTFKVIGQGVAPVNTIQIGRK